MLEPVDESLEAFLRATVPLSALDVDVSFEAPDREWSAKLTRPTVNLFLWDIRRSADRSKSGVATVVRDGVRVHQAAHPVVELRYVVTAWTSDHGDERALLTGLMRAILAHSALPHEFLVDEIAHLQSPTLTLARAGEDHMDVFKALEGQVKPGLNVVIASEFDTMTAVVAGPPVRSLETSTSQIGSTPERRRRVAGEVVDATSREAIGALVHSPTDSAEVNSAGQFLLRAEPGDEVVLETSPAQKLIVPEAGGIRFE